MITLQNILVSLSDTIFVTTPPKEVIFHSCPNASTVEDIWRVMVIGIIVIFSLWIIGYYVCKSVASVQKAKLDELNSRQKHELTKLDKEAEIKAAANQFNAEQTKKQREWLSEADRLKNEAERHNIRLKEAEINAKISKLYNSQEWLNEEEKIKVEYKRLDLILKEAETYAKIISVDNKDVSTKEQS